jgi:hypothetical protein
MKTKEKYFVVWFTSVTYRLMGFSFFFPYGVAGGGCGSGAGSGSRGKVSQG